MPQHAAQSNYQSDLSDIWRRAMDPHGVGMVEAISTEIAAYTGESPSAVLAHMARGKDEFAQLWRDARINPANTADVEAFYEKQFVEAYELADWHSGRTNGFPPLSYAHAAHIAASRRLARALDFGSGIGTGALCLLQAGCEVHCADIATELLRLAQHRIEQRGMRVVSINLSNGEQPRTNYYDLITCFDVLEHVPEPLAKLRELQSFLRPGGYLVTNLMNDSHDPDRPMHVSSAPDWLSWIRGMQLVPEWTLFFYGVGAPVQVFVKRPFGRLRNRAAALVDALQRRRSAG